MTQAPIPTFSPCPSCGSVAMRLAAGQPVTCAQCGAARTTNPQGFTKELKAICRENCAMIGDPPCWELPELSQPCEHITPCSDCLAGKVLEP